MNTIYIQREIPLDKPNAFLYNLGLGIAWLFTGALFSSIVFLVCLTFYAFFGV